jgi:hypothetical protein
MLVNQDIDSRLRRMYAAVGATIEEDLSFLRAQRFANGVGFNIRGSQSDEELANELHSAVYNVAHLRDHLRTWARANGKDAEKVRQAIRNSAPLQIIVDLSNTDKHGGSPPGGGWSGKSPRVTRISRAVRLHVGPEQRQTSVVFSFDGSPPRVEAGSADVAIVADVVDGKGKVLGDLQLILAEAVSAWERLVKELGLDSVVGRGDR